MEIRPFIIHINLGGVLKIFPKKDSLVSIPDQPLIKKSVDLALPLVSHSIPEETGDHTAHVLLVSSDSHESKSDPPIPVFQESPSPIPVQHGGNHMIPPPNSFVVSFDWGPLTAFHLPYYVLSRSQYKPIIW